MENCLVTKLKAVVNNSDLMKIGELDISLPAGAFITIYKNWINSPITVSVKSGTATALDEDDNSIPLPDTLQPSALNVRHRYDATTDCVLCITKVYNFKILDLPQAAYWDIDVEAFKYSPITYFTQSNNPYVHGDIKYVYKQGNTQTNIGIGHPSESNYGNLYGDISVFGDCLSLTSLTVRYQSGITGTIESMVHKYRENNRTTGSMTISVPTSGIITFNGAGITGNNKTLSWDATTITYDGTTITA